MASRSARRRSGRQSASYGWPEDAQFLVPDGVREHFDEGIGRRGAELRREWEDLLESYTREHESLAHEIDGMQRREPPEGWDIDIPRFEPDEKGMATRKASNQVENAVAARIPWLLAGSADLTDSTSVRLKDVEGAEDFEPAISPWPPASLRDPRARVGGAIERALPFQASARSGPRT